MIRGVVSRRTFKAGFDESGGAIGGVADESASPFGHDANVIEEFEDFRRRLMNRTQDGSTD